jgi:hypothetical protein
LNFLQRPEQLPAVLSILSLISGNLSGLEVEDYNIDMLPSRDLYRKPTISRHQLSSGNNGKFLIYVNLLEELNFMLHIKAKRSETISPRKNSTIHQLSFVRLQYSNIYILYIYYIYTYVYAHIFDGHIPH